jgi:hypothetical protein
VAFDVHGVVQDAADHDVVASLGLIENEPTRLSAGPRSVQDFRPSVNAGRRCAIEAYRLDRPVIFFNRLFEGFPWGGGYIWQHPGNILAAGWQPFGREWPRMATERAAIGR